MNGGEMLTAGNLRVLLRYHFEQPLRLMTTSGGVWRLSKQDWDERTSPAALVDMILKMALKEAERHEAAMIEAEDPRP